MSKKYLKTIGLTCLSVLLISCNSSSDDTALNIQGEWVSNCYELRDAESGEFINYAIDTYVFLKNSYSLTGVGYSDSDCITPNGNIDNYLGDYLLREAIVSSDNVAVFRLDLSQFSPDWPDSIAPIDISAVIYVNGKQFNLGQYGANGSSSINYDITYYYSESQDS